MFKFLNIIFIYYTELLLESFYRLEYINHYLTSEILPHPTDRLFFYRTAKKEKENNFGFFNLLTHDVVENVVCNGLHDFCLTSSLR